MEHLQGTSPDNYSGPRREKQPLTTYATQPILFINFSYMYKRYHAILMGVVKKYLVSYYKLQWFDFYWVELIVV